MAEHTNGNGNPELKKNGDAILAQKKPAGKGVPLWALPLGALLFVLLGLLIWATVWITNTKERVARAEEALAVQKAQNALDSSKAAEEGRIALARIRQNEALSTVRRATNSLVHLLAAVNRIGNDAATLKTSETGRTIAAQPELVPQAKRLFENDIPSLPSADEVRTKLESARRIEKQVVDSLGTTYEPSADLTDSAQTSTQWAVSSLIKAQSVQAVMASLISEAALKGGAQSVVSSTPKLENAVNQSLQAESLNRQKLIVEKTTEAKGDADIAIAQAEAKRIRDEAKLEAEEILRKANEAVAAKRREESIQIATAKIEDSKAQVKVSKAENEAETILLRQKASDPTLKAKLAPFLTPGYQLIPKGMSADMQPHSYIQLKSAGALEPTVEGMQKLVNIAHTRTDIVRPRWKFKSNLPKGWRKSPEDIEQVKEAQQLLIELGPVMVEMGLLSP